MAARPLLLERVSPYVPRVVMRHFAGDSPPVVAVVDATMVFVDISGFTKLSERLARKGREGAEHLSEAISSTFTSLLQVAYANGGSLLKFGGDALLLLFEDEAHAERACSAAARMQERLRDVGRIDAGGARVVLRMSVGVHSGEYALFLAGASHAELLVAGPAASRVVEMEGAAQAGEILVSHETAERLPDSCLSAERAGGRLLRRAPLDEDQAPVEQEYFPDATMIAGCLSTALRAHLSEGPQPPEHRTVTIAFIHFEGLDELIVDTGAAAASEALSAWLAAVQAAADAHRVCFLATDVAPGGGKVILTTGAPRALEEDEERMLLALHQILAIRTPLHVHAGVNRGPVFAGDVGPQYRRTYTVMGDAVNLAARLMAKAPEGSLYATADVLDSSATRFATEALEPFMVKGKAAPVEAWSVGRPLGRDAPEVTEDVPLVGRGEEMAALAAAVAGGGGLVEIAGEGGIGKTRLLEELREHADDARVLSATCEPYAASTPYALWRGLLRQLVRVEPEAPDEEVIAHLEAAIAHDEPELAPWLPLIAIPFDIDLPSTPEIEELAPEFRGSKLHDVVVRFLRGWLEQPTFVGIEDAQHMDHASAELLRAIAGVLPQSATVVVVTRRNVDGGFTAPEGGLRIDLGPLDAAATAELAESLTEERPLPPLVVRAAVERCGGNPQFLRDLLGAASAGDDTMPETVEAAAVAAIDRLGPDDRSLVRRAAVLGVSFDVPLLDDVLEGVSPPPDRVTWSRLSDVFVEEPDGRVRFRRAVVRDAAYDSLPFALRRRLHALLAARLERKIGIGTRDAAELLSMHYLLAGEHAAAWGYARMAADRARQRFAYGDAAALYRRALAAARGLPVERTELAAVWESLGEAHEINGELQAALEALRRARQLLTGDRVAQARVLERQALVALDGSAVSALRFARSGLRLLDEMEEGGEEAAGRARLISILATVRMRQGRADEAIELCERAVAEAELAGDDAALARACYILDWALVESSRAREAQHSERALAIYRSHGDLYQEASVLNNLGNFAYRQGRWKEAVELWTSGRDASMRAGALERAAFGDTNIGELLSDQGLLEEARVRLRRVLQTFRGIGNRWGTAYVQALLGRLAVRSGQRQEGEELLEAALEGFRACRVTQDRAFAEALIAESLVTAGRSRDALEAAERLLTQDSGGSRLAPLIHRVRGIALAQLGRMSEAEEALETSLAHARAQAEDFEVAQTLDVLCRLHALGGGDPRRCRERDEIVRRLNIVRLPMAPLAPTVAPAARL